MKQQTKFTTTKFTTGLTIIALIVGILMGCSSPYEQQITKDEDGNIKSSYTIRKEDGKKHGEYIIYIDGKLSEKGTFKEDVQVGTRTMYSSSEQILATEEYDNGQLISRKDYSQDGHLSSEGQYDAEGTMSGEWKYYYSNGQVREKITYQNNVEDGPFVEYYENGKIKTEGTYSPLSFGIQTEGVEQGELKEYNEDGVLVARKQCEDGKCKTVWTAEQGDIKE